MPAVVAIDNGSQSTKVLVVDETGRVRAQARVGLRPYATPAPGRSVHPDDDVWDSIVRACRLAMQRFDGDPSEIVGVGLCTIRFCRALLRADGTLAEPLLSWMDERVSRPHVPSPAVAHVTTSSGYVAHRLTGAFRDAAGNYQGVWPIDQTTWRWTADPDAAAATGMDRSLLSELVDPGAELGRVSVEASTVTGLPAGVPVFATSNDKAVEALGAGLSSPDDVLLSFGTYIAAMTVADAPGGGEQHWVNFGARPGQYLAESTGIRRGMWTVSWLRDLLHPIAPDDDIYAFDRSLGAEAESVPPGCDGVAAVLDWLAPGDEPNRRGAFVGFSGAQGRGHLYRAVLEAIAFTMADHVEAMERERGVAARGVIVTGGGAQSALLVQIVADVLGRPVRRALVDDAAGIGAAICAAVGAGVFPDWDAAASALSGTGDAVRPGAHADAYRALRPWHRGIRSRVAELSGWMASARG
ncbi:FGGY-family carbohydrate kinase [Microbacterium sp. NPDC090007]|uniref:FGGY-family carbohydrate kinase n=1 Tax=Microbacterium sp. NPDC090007 TaxID=3364204 RepID=UPI00380A5005